MELPTIGVIKEDRTGTTFVEQIKSIDNLFGEKEEYKSHKEELMREAFDIWERKNSIVRAVMKSKGKTTFLDVYERAFGGYNTPRIFAPYSLPSGFKGIVADLEDCIGESNLDDSIRNKIGGNPVGGVASAALLALGYMGYRAVRSKSPKYKKQNEPERRKILKALGGIVLAGLSGGLVGMSGSMSTLTQLATMEQNAIYLDTIYKRLYQK